MELNLITSQQSCSSIDSSNLSIASSFQSTQSLNSSKQNSQHNKNQDGQNSVKYLSPKQIPRYNDQKRESDLFQSFQQPQPFIGFVGMGKGKGKQIFIGESKLKRAKKFMQLDDDIPPFADHNKFNFGGQLQLDCKSESTQSIEDFKANSQVNYFKQPQFPQVSNFPEFSLGFTSMGTGKAVQISQQATNNAKAFFGQFDKSKTKQTKARLSITQKRQSERVSNFIKTQKTKFVHPRQNNKSTKIMKKSAQNQCKKYLQDMLLYKKQKQIKIKLSDMQIINTNEKLKFEQSWKRFKSKKLQIEHSEQFCSVKWCYFCQKYGKLQIVLTKQLIQSQVLSAIQFKEGTRNRIPKLIELVIFKLFKYEHFDPNIKNKRLNPNNILLEVYKKCLFYEKEKISPLECSVSSLTNSRGKNLGKHINLIIMSIDYNEQMQVNFIQLSDGWATVFAVIPNANCLSAFIGSRIIIGAKLQIVNWSLHPICNIIECHPIKQIAASGAHCIQFNYNNSMPSPYFSRLGWPKQLFYRPVSACRNGAAGNIPLVEGIIIRMFTIKNAKNVLTNYVQIMLMQKTCILMKVALAQQTSLVQLFRLYYSYHFLRIKKLSNNLLEFTPNSKFYQIQDQQRLDKVKQILKSRLFNLNLNILLPVLKQTKKAYIDLVTKSEQLIIDNKKVKIQEKIDGPVLLQQYAVTCEPQGYSLSKGDRGSCLRRIPKIYDSLQYNIL